MTLLIRQNLLTVLIFMAWPILNVPWNIAVTWCMFALILDNILKLGHSENILYKKDKPSQVFSYPSLTRTDALIAQISVAAVAAVLAVFAISLPRQSDWAFNLSLLSLTLSGAAASYFGFTVSRSAPSSPLKMLSQMESMVGELFFLNLLPRNISRFLGSLVRAGIGILGIVLYLLTLKLRGANIGAPILLFETALSIFFQVGFVLLTQSLFTITWFAVDAADSLETKSE